MSALPVPAGAPEHLTLGSARGRVTLTAVTLGSGIAILDGSIVNVALKTIGADLDASLAQLQWVVNGYLLALASLVLVGGALGDRWGRRRVYLVGMGWFLVGSVACALAQSPEQLVTMRFVQGVGAALLTPGALAIIQSSFRAQDRGAAIGTWAGLSGIATAVGPFVGGWIVDYASWRWIFAINVPLCLVVIALAWWAAPESRTPSPGRFDGAGAVLAVVGLGTLTFALTDASTGRPAVVAGTAALAVAALTAFLLVEHRRRSPLLPLGLFRSRVFSAANAMTFLVYGALAVQSLVLVLQLQVSAGWSALAAGLTALPVTAALMLLSTWAGALSSRIGPRLPMTVGPLVCAAGLLLLLGAGQGTRWYDVLPGLVVFALGLALLVSPLTTAVLAAAPEENAGVASGINNAVARAGSLLAVAALPVLAGLSGDSYLDPAAMTSGYRVAIAACAALMAAGGVISWFGLGPRVAPVTNEEAGAPSPPLA
ncbi:MFS transporter [Ornithinimicrobium pekingense]|uniref:MFS transporter n=1 Tax=Ornithinimicrobium pekingense TaxID=384677 RepID=A0ABQ2FDC9_9MICO|nr:MFS transporter [Ornithinimicrobium pekingense]GGK78220.1 MFS transporter [Ornithinimicrobium pekingense]